MKRKIFLSFLFAFFCLFVFADNENSQIKNEEDEYIFIPTLGFGAVGVNTGVDFMYRNKCGFAMFVNLNLSVPLTLAGGVISTSELYLGYALKKNNFYAIFSAGPLLGGGLVFHKPSKYIYGKKNMNGPFDYAPAFLFSFALRGDFDYFFSEKLGLNFSHTHAFGLHASRWIMQDNHRHVYSFMLKLGLAIKV